MRIAYVSADHGIPVFGDKGACVHVQELVRAFAALGHDVHLLAARLGTGGESLPCVAEKIAVQAVPPRPESEAADDPQRLEKERRYLRIADAAEARLLALHAEQPFDAVYERYSLWSRAGVRAARKLGIPCIVEMNAPLLLEQQRYRKLELAGEAAAVEREVLTGADAVLCVSEEVAAYARSRGAAATARVVPNGVDLERFHDGVPAWPLPGQEHSLVVGFVGSLKEWHGVDVLLEAFALLHAEAPDTHLLIAGDGPMRGFVEGFARGARLDGAITVTGWLPHRELPAVLRRMDVATAPYPQLDGFYFSPLKLFEYLAAGVPVVASRIGQVEQVIAHGRTGLLCEPGDAACFARCILELAARPARRLALARAGRELVAGHSWRRNAEEVVTLARALGRAA